MSLKFRYTPEEAIMIHKGTINKIILQGYLEDVVVLNANPERLWTVVRLLTYALNVDDVIGHSKYLLKQGHRVLLFQQLAKESDNLIAQIGKRFYVEGHLRTRDLGSEFLKDSCEVVEVIATIFKAMDGEIRVSPVECQ